MVWEDKKRKGYRTEKKVREKQGVGDKESKLGERIKREKLREKRIF